LGVETCVQLFLEPRSLSSDTILIRGELCTTFIMSAFARPAVRYAGIASVAATGSYLATRSYNSNAFGFTQAHAESAPSDAKAALKKMPWKGFTELKVESVEMVNHNVKKLTFALPDNETISGIAPISKVFPISLGIGMSRLTPNTASLLTQHTPEGGWIPVMRPYTPISPNGKSHV
jgi:hypothetical protein